MNTQINKPRVVGFAVYFVFFSITRSFFAKFQSAYTAFQTARVPSFAAHFNQISVHNSTFATSAFLPVYLETRQTHVRVNRINHSGSEWIRPDVNVSWKSALKAFD